MMVGLTRHEKHNKKSQTSPVFFFRERLPAFERMLWRACRGNVFLRQAEIEDPLEDPQLGGDEVYKSVFVIFFQVNLLCIIDWMVEKKKPGKSEGAVRRDSHVPEAKFDHQKS